MPSRRLIAMAFPAQDSVGARNKSLVAAPLFSSQSSSRMRPGLWLVTQAQCMHSLDATCFRREAPVRDVITPGDASVAQSLTLRDDGLFCIAQPLLCKRVARA